MISILTHLLIELFLHLKIALLLIYILFIFRLCSVSLSLSLLRLSLIEPGPVHTEFEAKMIQEVKQRECPGADPDTVHYFKNVYLPSSIDIFEAIGQTPDDVARVGSQAACDSTSL